MGLRDPTWGPKNSGYLAGTGGKGTGLNVFRLPRPDITEREDFPGFVSFFRPCVRDMPEGRYEEAEVVLEDRIAVNSEYRNTYTVLGPVQLALGKYDEALATLQKANGLRESPTVLVNLGAAQALTGRSEDALASVDRALAGGFGDFDAIEGSPYYAAFREDPRLKALLDKYREGTRD